MKQTQVPQPDVDEESFDWPDDSLAQFEKSNWDKEELSNIQKNANNLRFLKWLRYVIPVSLVFFALLFLLSLAIWSWHYLMPFGWPKEDQLAKIQSVIFSETLGAIVSTILTKHLFQLRRFPRLGKSSKSIRYPRWAGCIIDVRTCKKSFVCELAIDIIFGMGH